MIQSTLLAQVELSAWWILLIIFVVVVLPFILGALIARGLGLKDLSVRLGIVLFAIFLFLSPFVWQGIAGWLERREYRERLALWEERQERMAVTEDGLEELQQTQPNLTIQR